MKSDKSITAIFVEETSSGLLVWAQKKGRPILTIKIHNPEIGLSRYNRAPVFVFYKNIFRKIIGENLVFMDAKAEMKLILRALGAYGLNPLSHISSVISLKESAYDLVRLNLLDSKSIDSIMFSSDRKTYPPNRIQAIWDCSSIINTALLTNRVKQGDCT